MLKNHHNNYDETNKHFSGEGIFRFLSEGFFVNEEDFVKWKDIQQIVCYNVTFYENSITFIEIYTDMKSYKFNEETSGWYQLVSKIQTSLHDIDKSWNLNNFINHSHNGKTVIYRRQNSG